MIYVIALNHKIAEDQMRSYGYTKAEWKFCGTVYDLTGRHGSECFVLSGANKRKGSLTECYHSLIIKAREFDMNIHYKQELHLGKPSIRTEDIRNDLYCCW